MNILIKSIDNISNFFGYAAGTLMILGTMLTILEITFRFFLNSTLYITTEYLGYFMVAISFLGLALTLKDKEHIRITFLHKLIKKGKPRIILDFFTFVVGGIVSFFILIGTTKFFLHSLDIGSQSTQISNTYLFIPQFSIVLGSFMLFIQFISEILKYTKAIQNKELDLEEGESQFLGH